MAVELWLKFVENGETKRILVEGEKFTVGRHSESDLSINEASLSRKHIRIERFNNIFIISDLGSSYGTKLNDKDLDEPVALKNGDVLNLGGGFEIKVEIESDEENFGDAETSATIGDNKQDGEDNSEKSPQNSVSAQTATADTGFLNWKFLLLAPLFGCCFLGAIGTLFYAFSDKTQVVENRRIPEYETPTRTPRFSTDDKDKEETPEPTAEPTAKPSETATPVKTGTPAESDTPIPQNTNDTDKIERNALAFTRKIAVNDNNYFFSRSQLGEINSSVKDFSGSQALRDNLKAVRQNSSQFAQLADSKGLKPQFLATAALAKLGNSRGNPVQTAQEILPVLGELKITLGNELTDDNLLIIAAYDQGTRGEFRAMRNTVEVLSKAPGVDVRRARTVWYLREKGKLSDAQYRFVLRFLAIGTIMQKPTDFNVQAEPTVFE